MSANVLELLAKANLGRSQSFARDDVFHRRGKNRYVHASPAAPRFFSSPKKKSMMKFFPVTGTDDVRQTQPTSISSSRPRSGRYISMGKKSQNLSEEQLSQIAGRIGAQLKQQQLSAPDGANRRGRTGAYLMGAASGLLLALAAPLLRPVMRSAVKGGILAGRYARQVGANMKEGFEDLVAEAEAELDEEKGESKEEV
jgi:hypothetical protein